jgi:hypothetical protein
MLTRTLKMLAQPASIFVFKYFPDKKLVDGVLYFYEPGFISLWSFTCVALEKVN